MSNSFGGLDDIDREAMKEGLAISRLKGYSSKERPVKGKEASSKIKNRRREKGKEEGVDILKILNIIQGKR